MSSRSHSSQSKNMAFPSIKTEKHNPLPSTSPMPKILANSNPNPAPQKSSSPNLLDLPEELRIMIYRASFTTTQPNICSLQTPPLTRLSRRLRAESLPIFYSEATFIINIFSNYFDPAWARHVFEAGMDKPEEYASRNGEESNIGVVHVTRGMREFLEGREERRGGQEEEKGPCPTPPFFFKHLEFRASDSIRTIANMRQDWMLPTVCSPMDPPCDLLMKICKGGKEISATVLGPAKDACSGREYPYILQTGERVKRVAEKLVKAGGKEFRGFTMRKLEAIAWEFRWSDEVLLEMTSSGKCCLDGEAE